MGGKNEKPVGVLSEIQIKITIFLLVLFVVLIFSLLFCFFQSWREELTFIAATIGGGAIVYGGYYTAISFKTSLIEEKKHRSFEILREFIGYDLTKVRTFLESEIETKEIPPKDIYDRITSDKELLPKVGSSLNYIEFISLTVQEEYVDEIIMYKNLNFLVKYLYDGFYEYIVEMQKRKDDKSIYNELVKLAIAWKAKKTLLTGEDLPPLT